MLQWQTFFLKLIQNNLSWINLSNALLKSKKQAYTGAPFRNIFVNCFSEQSNRHYCMLRSMPVAKLIQTQIDVSLEHR